MSERHAGWSIVEAYGVPVRVFGAQVYYHAGREEYAIERDGQYLGHMNATEATVMEHILKLQVAAKGGRQ